MNCFEGYKRYVGVEEVDKIPTEVTIKYNDFIRRTVYG